MGFVSRIRWGGVFALLGGALGIALIPVAAAAGHLAWGDPMPRPWSDSMPLLVDPFRFYVEPLFGLPQPNEVYPTYGKVFFLVFLLFLGGVAGLSALLGDRLGKRGRLGQRLLVVGLIMNLFGNVSDYWLGYDVLGQPWWGLLFVIGTMLGWLIYAAGSAFVGAALLLGNILPKWIGWAFVAVLPLGVLFTFWGIEHVPSGLVFPMSVCWLLVGLTLLLRSASAPAQLEPASIG